uniref:Putative monocarboxylate transporter n=1 Tax=Rhipicephalus pulchellus TaxID=72859 RepID=L7M4S1_RHIPC
MPEFNVGPHKHDPDIHHGDGCASVIKRPISGSSVNKSSNAAGPDGRLSWAIAVTCFVINFIASGFYRCTGMFFNSIMETFGASRGDASFPVSLYGAFYNVTGLVAGALIQSIGVRCTILLGGIMMSVGFSVSFFATSTLFVVLTVGVITGAGHGIVISCCIVAVTRYFDKRRGIALGLNLAGPPVTSLVVPKLLEWLLSEYGLRGTLLLLGACLANVPVLGILLRDPPWENNIRDTTTELEEHTFTQVPNGGVRSVSVACNNNMGEAPGEISAEEDLIPTLGRRQSTIISVAKCTLVRQSMTTNINQCPVADVVTRGATSNVNGHRSFLAAPSLLTPGYRPSIASIRSSTVTGMLGKEPPSELTPSVSTVLPKGAAMERRGTMMSVAGSIFAAKRPSLNEAERYARRGTVISVIGPCKVGDLHKTTLEVTKAEAPSSALSSLKEVLSAPRMYLHTFSYFTYSFFMDSYLAVMFDLGEDVGVPLSESVLALTILSAMDAGGRLFVPFVSDYGITSTMALLTACYLWLTVVSALVPLVSGKLAFMAVSAILGLPVGYLLVGTSESLSTELGTKHMPMAYGVLALVTAVGSFVRPPVIGAFRDKVGSYHGLFQLMAGILALALILNIVLWINGRLSSKRSPTEKAAVQDCDVPVFISDVLPPVTEEAESTSL